MDRFYITTPIYYVNDVPHLGHAYTTLVADSLARYHRCRGRDVHFLTGTDEHGQKIEQAAQQRGLTAQALANEVVERFRQSWVNLGVHNDDFIRTTEERHKEVVQKMWQRLQDAGDIYLGHYEGLYCVGCEEYYTETQLIDGKCPIHGTKPDRLQQPSYFFRMSKYQDQLLEHFEKNPQFVQPDIRRNEIVSFIKSGLRDLSVSRTTFDWGIHVPGDEQHVIYVWVDALTNYISALGGFDAGAPKYDQFWPVDIHLIGKDILRFHAVYWPTMLMAAGLPLPKQIFAHGWWTVNGQKMSKSLRNAVEPNMLAADIGRDAVRYFVMRETPLGADGDFSHEALIQRINSDLANDLGNLLNRSLAMAYKYCDGRVPAFAENLSAEQVDKDFIALARATKEAVQSEFEAPAPSRALERLWQLVRGANKYIDTTAPYKLIKDPANKRRVQEVVANFLEALRWISMLVAPVMPDTALEIRRQLGLGDADPDGQLANWPKSWGEMPQGLELQRKGPLFPRIDDDKRAELFAKWKVEGAGPVQTKKDSEAEAKKSSGKKAKGKKEKAPIKYDDFAQLDLKVGTIKTAERIEGADRLLKLTVEVGEPAPRQVVAGIAEAYGPEELPGKQVIVVANLEPAKIRGVESQGMLLAAGGKKVLALGALDREVTPGTPVS
jgi:methionyl-tRNA synthetase